MKYWPCIVLAVAAYWVGWRYRAAGREGLSRRARMALGCGGSLSTLIALPVAFWAVGTLSSGSDVALTAPVVLFGACWIFFGNVWMDEVRLLLVARFRRPK
jgi:hypothetical protein